MTNKIIRRPELIKKDEVVSTLRVRALHIRSCTWTLRLPLCCQAHPASSPYAAMRVQEVTFFHSKLMTWICSHFDRTSAKDAKPRPFPQVLESSLSDERELHIQVCRPRVDMHLRNPIAVITTSNLKKMSCRHSSCGFQSFRELKHMT